METNVTDDTVVGIHYTLKDEEGQIIESSDGETPLTYLHGHGQIIPGLESALNGKSIGDRFTVTVPPAEGYGELDDRLMVELDRAQFPESAELEVGDVFEAALPETGPLVIRVVEIDGSTVKVDGNHPLAGRELTFEVEVISIRAATKSELEHGHAHHGDGHKH